MIETILSNSYPESLISSSENILSICLLQVRRRKLNTES